MLTIDSDSLENYDSTFDIASGANVKLHQSVKAAQTQGILTVDSTKGFENTTTLTVQDPVRGPVTITYTGITSTTFTGCTSTGDLDLEPGKQMSVVTTNGNYLDENTFVFEVNHQIKTNLSSVIQTERPSNGCLSRLLARSPLPRLHASATKQSSWLSSL